jgi:signal transduction histidine kinase
MKLHVPTLAFILGLINLTQVAALGLHYRINRAYRGIGWWLVGSIAMAAGFICLVLGGPKGVWWLGPFGNPLLIVSRLCLMVGTLRFLDRPGRRTGAALALAGAIAVYYWFLFIVPDIAARTVVVSVAIAGFSLAIAGSLLRRPDPRFARSARFTAGVFLAHAGYLLLLASATLARGPIRTYLEYSFFQSLAFVLPAITSTLWTFGFILMLNQRLGAEHLEDMAELRRTEQEKAELERRNRQLQKAESLGRMAGAIAHHFNNQLQAVMGSLDLLEADLQGAGAGGSLARAKQATERAAEVGRLMRVYLGQTHQDQALLDLSGLCHGGLDDLQATIPSQVRLQARFSTPGPVVRANAGQVRQALANLLGNACEAMGEAGGELRVAVGAGPAEAIPVRNRFPVDWQAQARDYAHLEVADSGPGMDPADIEKVCDPFYSTRFTGRGLGLSVVLGIAQAHGGAITIQSQPGAGSGFRVYFPVVD